MTLDHAKLMDKVRLVEGHVAKLEALAGVPAEEFAADYTKAYAARYMLQTSVEAMIDIANHIIARRGWGSPKSYVESFELLGQNGGLPPQLVDTCKRLARFRNRLVHLYQDIDDHAVYDILQNHLGDFRAYTRLVGERFLKQP